MSASKHNGAPESSLKDMFTTKTPQQTLRQSLGSIKGERWKSSTPISGLVLCVKRFHMETRIILRSQFDWMSQVRLENRLAGFLSHRRSHQNKEPEMSSYSFTIKQGDHVLHSIENVVLPDPTEAWGSYRRNHLVMSTLRTLGGVGIVLKNF